MLATFLYCNEKVSREALTDLFLKVLAAVVSSPEDAYDEDADLERGLQGLATAIEALSPARNKNTNELTGTIKGEEVETLFFKHWVIAYVDTLSRRGYHPDNPIEGETGKMDPKNEKQAVEYREMGNSPDWENPVANGTIEMPRWLVIRSAQVVGEIDGVRAAQFYDYARAREASKPKFTPVVCNNTLAVSDGDETRDPETKGPG